MSFGLCPLRGPLGSPKIRRNSFTASAHTFMMGRGGPSRPRGGCADVAGAGLRVREADDGAAGPVLRPAGGLRAAPAADPLRDAPARLGGGGVAVDPADGGPREGDVLRDRVHPGPG